MTKLHTQERSFACPAYSFLKVWAAYAGSRDVLLGPGTGAWGGAADRCCGGNAHVAVFSIRGR